MHTYLFSWFETTAEEVDAIPGSLNSCENIGWRYNLAKLGACGGVIVESRTARLTAVELEMKYWNLKLHSFQMKP